MIKSQVKSKTVYTPSPKSIRTPRYFLIYEDPIKHLWSSLKRKMSNHNPKDLDELWNLLKIEWTNIQKHECKKLVDNYSNRLREVIKQKGGPTRYQINAYLLNISVFHLILKEKKSMIQKKKRKLFFIHRSRQYAQGILIKLDDRKIHCLKIDQFVEIFFLYHILCKIIVLH